MRKEDVEIRYEFGRPVPACNVKVRDTLEKGLKKAELPEEFNLEWIEENVPEEAIEEIFWVTCEYAWEELQDYAEEIYHKRVRVYSSGRSSGWAIIDGINQDLDTWDAVELMKWRRFCKRARELADTVMTNVATSIYFNYYEN